MRLAQGEESRGREEDAEEEEVTRGRRCGFHGAPERSLDFLCLPNLEDFLFCLKEKKATMGCDRWFAMNRCAVSIRVR